jgi:hypothetical protein
MKHAKSRKLRQFSWEDSIQEMIAKKAVDFGGNRSAYLRYLVLRDNPEFVKAAVERSERYG